MIPIIVPDLSFDEVADSIRAILDSGILTSGTTVERFERAVADRVGAEHAVATTSATSALHLALAVLDIGPGDEVLVSDFTFPATANVVIQTGATPVFVDSRSDAFALDPADAARRVTARTRAVLAVDPFGQPADHPALAKVAAEGGFPVIVDAACSLGSELNGRPAGAHGLMSCFSFHPRKVVTCGEGGMITTADTGLTERLRRLRSHGGERDGVAMRFVEPGYNYRLSEVQAALGLAQMVRLDEILADRAATAHAYDERLAVVPGVTVPTPPPGATWTYQSYVVVLDEGIDRDGSIGRMAELGVQTTIGTYACHQHPAYARYGYAGGDLPNSHRFARQALTLPVVPRMDPADVDRVVAALVEVVGR